jgi:hypothetical protein
MDAIKLKLKPKTNKAYLNNVKEFILEKNL